VRLSLMLRSVAATAIPITVAGIGPLWLISATTPIAIAPWRWIFLAPMVAGVCFGAWSVVLFAIVGRGTLAPIDPPTAFVARGPYQFTRNPMYVGVSCWLLGLAALTNARILWWYALGAMLGFHAFVVLYEEPNLRRRFGASYDAYTQHVPRWLGRRRGTPAT